MYVNRSYATPWHLSCIMRTVMHLTASLVNDRSLENAVASRIIILADDRSEVAGKHHFRALLKAPHTSVSIRKDYLEAPSSSIHNSFSFRLTATPYDASRFASVATRLLFSQPSGHRGAEKREAAVRERTNRERNEWDDELRLWINFAASTSGTSPAA